MPSLQGVIKAFDPVSGFGSLVKEPNLEEVDLAANALAGSPFRFLRQGQRVNFDLNEEGQAIKIRFGSENDMLTPTERPPS